MEFKILSKEFWSKTFELYGYDRRLIKEMDDVHYKLGLRYKDTNYNNENSDSVCFIFEVIDKKKFFLTKLKYGF
jgi:hypothetical protein